MEVDMRHSKLKAEEAAIIAGEVEKPSWASRNEGIHERVSFEDTIWGFELAGGAYYKTPIRVVYVKPGSRAEQACIRIGDTVLRINDIDTSTLTLQEAHQLIIESGIHLKISVTSPDDDVDAFYVYKDPIVEDEKIPEEVLKAMEAERIRKIIAKTTRHRNLQWPWVRRKMIIYRESNCFLVPSKYEGKHQEQFPELPHVRYTDDITEYYNVKNKVEADMKEEQEKAAKEAKKLEKNQHENDVSENELIDEEFDELVDNLSENGENEPEVLNEVDTERLQNTEDITTENDIVENEDKNSVEVIENGDKELVNGEELIKDGEEVDIGEDTTTEPSDIVENEDKDVVIQNEEEESGNREEFIENGEEVVIGESENSINKESIDDLDNHYNESGLETSEEQSNEGIINKYEEIENTNEYINELKNKNIDSQEEYENEEVNKLEEEKIVDGIIIENGQSNER